MAYPDAEGVGFYRKTFTVPSEWRDRVLRLHFGGASYRAEAWLNGVYVGSHEGAYTPFSFDVTSAIRAGAENQLVVRVAALSKTRDVDGMALAQSPALSKVSRRTGILLDGLGVAGLRLIALLAAATSEYSPFLFRGGLVVLSVATAAVLVVVTSRRSVGSGARVVATTLDWRSLGRHLPVAPPGHCADHADAAARTECSDGGGDQQRLR